MGETKLFNTIVNLEEKLKLVLDRLDSVPTRDEIFLKLDSLSHTLNASIKKMLLSTTGLILTKKE